ncbi:MBL fold metallo-hydrolase [Halobaculum sp. P14]|uniref:MBL fold metallo-hydrolase n=1 Tax=Halobaculum sp. P14 TaxID=3421638 RepID=UPI003EB825DD
MHVDQFSVPVDTRAPTGQTNAYVVVGPAADRDRHSAAGDADSAAETETLLVDPAARTDTLDTVVREKGVDHVAVTHAHPDHVGAVADYARESGATVWARRGREDRFRDAAGVAPDRTFAEGDRVGPATVLDTPGHAPDHVCFAVANRILCGDVAVADGSVAVAAPEGRLRAYLTALRRLHARNPAALYPGHGPRIDDAQVTCARLIRHRLDREASVLDAVRAGATDPDAVVDAAYDADLTGVRNLARATAVAHIEKLAWDGLVEWDAAAERVTPR